MITVNVGDNVAQVLRGMDDATKRVMPLALAKALTFTAEAVQKAEVAEMQRVFKAPIPYTLRGVFRKNATPSRLEAVTWIANQRTASRIAQSAYLSPEIKGGQRHAKAFELALRAVGALPAGMYAVPGPGARIDAAGNMSGAQLQQILVYFKARPPRATPPGRRAAKRTRKPASFTVIKPGDRAAGWLSPGIYQLTARTISLVLLFIDRAPTYEARFDWDAVARKTATLTFDTKLKEGVAREIRQAMERGKR